MDPTEYLEIDLQGIPLEESVPRGLLLLVAALIWQGLFQLLLSPCRPSLRIILYSTLRLLLGVLNYHRHEL
jgi:hypothetical protein